jgi:hypothetical protein
MNTKQYDTTKWMTVAEALSASGFGNSYLRMHILKENKVPSIKEAIPGTSIVRILIDRPAFEAYLKSHGRAPRTDGRVRVVGYATPEEIEALKALAASTGAELVATKPAAK